MSRGSLTELDPRAFLDLVSECGLQLKELELAKLARNQIVEPWQRDEEVSCYTELHLFVVAHYFEVIGQAHHPWAKPPEISLDGVSELGTKLNHLLDIACEENADSDRKVQEFMMELERFLGRIDPFGPLGDIFDLLQPQVRASLRNSGRLYLELRRGASQISLRLEDEISSDNPMTKPMFLVDPKTMVSDAELRSTQVIDESAGETSEAARQAIDEVLSAASEASDATEESEPPRSSRPAREMAKVPPTPTEEEDSRDTQVLASSEVKQGGLEEETSEPVLLEEEVSEEEFGVEELGIEDLEAEPPEQGFSRDDVPTRRTEDLAKRLKTLRKHDEKRTDKADDSLEREEESTEVESSEAVAGRIAELNRRREIYLKKQQWKELTELYEDGMELFSNPAERQQVFLVLGMLYEVKLRKKEQAFDAFAGAWGEREAVAGHAKALEGLQRLGRAASLQKRYVEWLRTQLATSLKFADAARLQKELALVLFADEEYKSCFSSYADFLSTDPNRSISLETLTQLQRFAERVDSSKMDAFLESLLEQELEPKIADSIAEFMTGTSD